jgi:DNA-binding response OmpR family regulator
MTPTQNPQPPQRTILLADDDEALLKALAVRLEHEGYRVITTLDAYQALDHAVKHDPDLLVLDINMPAGRGFSVAQRMTRINHLVQTPVLFLTGDPDPSLRAQALALGAVGFVTKPFDTVDLLYRIRMAVRAAQPA